MCAASTEAGLRRGVMARGGLGTCGRKTAGAKSWSGSDRHKQVKAGYGILERKS